MRQRPKVKQILVTAPAFAGQPLDVSVVLESKSATPVDSIRLTLEGDHKLSRDRSRLPLVPVARLVHEEVVLSGKGELAPGTRPFRARFRLRPDLPASYAGQQVAIAYELELYVDIPWWPDLRERYSVVLSPPVSARRPPRRLLRTTAAPGSDAIFLEIALDDQVFAPGDVLSGALALGNLRGRKVKGISMALCGVESSAIAGPFGAVTQVGEGARFLFHFGPVAAGEGVELPFRLALPKTLAPTFQSGPSSLSWVLEVVLDVAWSSKRVHRFPVEIRALDRPSESAAARPRLGHERWRGVWGEAGAPYGLALDPEDLELTGVLAGRSARVFLDHDADPPALAAELRWPSWGTGFLVRVRRVALFASGGDDGFGKRYRVEGREAAQVRALLTPELRRALLAFDEVYADDEHVRVKGSSKGFDQPYIGELLARRAALAASLRISDARMVPPAALASAVPAWRGFAEELSGTLALGPMAITGATLEGARFDLVTVFDGANVERTRLGLVVDPPLAEPFDPESEESLTAAPPGTREVVAALREGSLELRVAEHAIDVDLAGPVSDPAALRERMAAMLSLARRLRKESVAGPYR